MADPIELLCCYAHDDEKSLQALLDHLKPLERMGEIHIWHDRQIEVGADRNQARKASMERAQIILLLISASFLASDYSYSQELERALERQRRYEACVIPVILRHCAWQITPIGQLQPLPRNRKPISAWDDSDNAFFDVFEGVQRVVAQLRVPMLMREAEAYYQKQEYKEALHVYEQALARQQTITQPDKQQRTTLALIYQGQADVFYAQGHFEKAERQYDQALALDDALAHSNERKGSILIDAYSDYNSAVSYLKRAMQQHPGNQRIPPVLIDALVTLNREAEAVAFCEEILPRFPQSLPIQERSARLLQKVGKYDQALTAWEQVIGLVPDVVKYHQHKAEVLEALQRYKDALDVYQKIEKLKPDDLQVFIRQGQLLTRLWRYEEALVAYRKTLKWDSQIPEVYFGIRGLYEAIAQRYTIQALQIENNAKSYHGQFNLVHTLRGHDGRISCLALSPDGETLASASYDGSIRIWSLVAGPYSRFSHPSAEIVRDMAFNREGTMLVYCGAQGSLVGRACATGQEIFAHRNTNVTTLIFSPHQYEKFNSGRYLLCGGNDGSISMWSRSGQWMDSFKICSSPIMRLAFRSPYTWLACTDQLGGTVAFWILFSPPVEIPSAIQVAGKSKESGPVIWSLFFSPDERVLFGGTNAAVYAWEVSSRKLLWFLEVEGQSFQCCTLSANGRWLACGLSDHTMRIWHLSEDYLSISRKPIILSTGSVTDLAFSHNGRVLVAGLEDGTIEIWMRE